MDKKNNEMKPIYILFCFLFCYCYHSSQTKDFFQEYDSPDDAGCYLVMPIGNSHIAIIKNLSIRELYYQKFTDSFTSYPDFLSALYNKNQKLVTYPQKNKYKIKSNIIVESRTDFSAFRKKYLDYVDPYHIYIRPEYLLDKFSIIKACFDAGLYVYADCCSGDYSFSEAIIVLPDED